MRLFSVALTVFAALVVGCSNEDPVPIGDAGAKDALAPCVCAAPFVCKRFDGGVPGCESPSASVPTCKAAALKSTIPFKPVTGGQPVHWAMAPGCITVSYDSALSSMAPKIKGAVDAFGALSCSKLCFEAPTQSDNAPELLVAIRRIHFKAESTSARAETQVTFETTTGRILNVTVHVDPSKLAGITPAEVLTLFGYGIGLKAAPTGKASIMNTDNASSTITDDDKAAICEVYGALSFCGD